SLPDRSFFPDQATLARIKAQILQKQNTTPLAQQQSAPQIRQFKVDLSKGATLHAFEMSPCSIPLLSIKPAAEKNYKMRTLNPPQIDHPIVVQPPAPTCATKTAK